MGGFFKRYQNLLILAALVVLTLSILLSNLREKSSLNAVERVVIAVLSPFQDIVGWSVGKASLAWENYLHLVDVKKENAKLGRSLDRLVFENGLLTERLKHFERLESLLSFPKVSMIPFEAARIIGRDTLGRVKLLIINKGAGDGLAEGMPVITHRGLVGRVVRVSGSASKALMITDVRSAVDAVVQETRGQLVASGSNLPTLEVRYLSVGADVTEGERVISSGLGGVFPKGLLVGSLTNIKKEGDSLFLSARLEPAVDLDRIEEVLVLKSSPSDIFSKDDWP
ncbi:Rod shape-determining protein MreC [hydrothermal vent metagenome]|uniref:Cell shape-determining protein MreC n=1 Tax=hydrothermal vent metagenome TaxID=652676 RepID=A0A3B1CFJ3_9ZZZZ